MDLAAGSALSEKCSWVECNNIAYDLELARLNKKVLADDVVGNDDVACNADDVAENNDVEGYVAANNDVEGYVADDAVVVEEESVEAKAKRAAKGKAKVVGRV
ncbi:hypothetical protein M0R45_007015 [Rubus argutus]|uniref:Uncharacterized protein n=1 Tax=Rubus argutus TaxID=59490 RepID=A0AAW1YSY5_RUBAR